jgi:hypothetical protein
MKEGLSKCKLMALLLVSCSVSFLVIASFAEQFLPLKKLALLPPNKKLIKYFLNGKRLIKLFQHI